MRLTGSRRIILIVWVWTVDIALIFFIQIIYAIAVLIMISLGLALVFGMMRIINLAHGEFITLGGYATIVATKAGLNIWVAMLLVSPVVVGLWSLLIERLIIRFLYGRLIYTMLATWGLSLAMAGGLTMILGNTTEGVALSIGSIPIGVYQVNGYNLFVILTAVTISMLLAWVLYGTVYGRIARAAMQNREMTQAFGYPVNRIYMLTFVGGGALAGLAGGVLAPTTSISPFSGVTWIADAFITVITGGSAPLLGTLASAGILGLASTSTVFVFSSASGGIALLITALILLRLFPLGISSLWRRSGK